MKLRAIRALVLSAFVATALQWPSISTAQQAFPSFSDVDFFYAQQPQLFQDLWQQAESQTVRIAVLGDSQETSPNSHGFQYIPLLNYEMWKRFGNTPETPVVGCFPYGTTTPGNWLLAGVCGTPGPVATRLSATQILPNARPRAFSTLNSSVNITGGSRGQLTMLQQDASGVDASAEIPTNASYFNTSGVVKARIYAATNPSSGEIAYQARPNQLSSPSYSAAITTTGTLTLGLQSPTFAIKSGTTTALNFNGNDYMALEVFGSSDTELTDLVGLRFVNETHPEGVVIDTFSLSAYTATNFLNAHSDAGAMFRAFGFHAAVIHYGANEGTNLTATQFQSNISAVISRVRNWVGDSTFPIILISDVYQSRPTTAQYDQYVGAQLAIAQTDPNVMVVNARRLMEDIGWNATSGQSSQYLDDGVHYTALGAQVLAKAVVAAMLGEIRTNACPNDPGAVALQTAMTLVVELGGAAACTNYGRLTVAQSLTLNHPALKVTLNNGFAPAAGDQFKILSFASAIGTFGSISLPALASNLSWNTSELYRTGSIKVVSTTTPPTPPDPPDPPSPPPPLPNAPTISVTSGANQSITLPNSASPIDFTLTGAGALTVTPSSSNSQLLPDSDISVSAGCGEQTLVCTATVSPASGQTGTATVSLTVTDANNRSAATSATIIINPAPTEAATGGGSGTGNDIGTGGTNNASSGRGGGGGSMDLFLLTLLCSVPVINKRSTRNMIRG